MATILDKMGHLGDLANHLTEVQLQAALAFNNLGVLRRWPNFLFITRSPERIESIIRSESLCSGDMAKFVVNRCHTPKCLISVD